jgi:gamma-D-glutamyl-L-lysine dipeptidyl-peptidase
MKYGIAILSVIPLRKEMSHRSEQVSQLLFGETYEILQKQGNWIFIKCSYDAYEGWMDDSQHHELNERDFLTISASDPGVALEMVNSAVSSAHAVPILAGSSLPFFDGMNFKIAREKFIYNGQAIQSDAKNSSIFERIALRYINAPYLWGGRSPFGIDCSGFTQLVYKFVGVPLLRDAWQQAGQGALVNFIEESQPGDLAFFGNEESRIVHVGIILKDSRIIHASGKVRIDKLDHFGIFNAEKKKYSHSLKIIKRLF